MDSGRNDIEDAVDDAISGAIEDAIVEPVEDADWDIILRVQ